MANDKFHGDQVVMVVAAALFDTDGRVLVQQRPSGGTMAGLWEFPGGKVEVGERPREALCRELLEELGIVVDPSALEPLLFADEAHGSRQLLLMLYRCGAWSGEFELRHAAAMQWMDLRQLHTLPMPPADRPLAAHLLQLFRGIPG